MNYSKFVDFWDFGHNNAYYSDDDEFGLSFYCLWCFVFPFYYIIFFMIANGIFDDYFLNEIHGLRMLCVGSFALIVSVMSVIVFEKPWGILPCVCVVLLWIPDFGQYIRQGIDIEKWASTKGVVMAFATPAAALILSLIVKLLISLVSYPFRRAMLKHLVKRGQCFSIKRREKYSAVVFSTGTPKA